MGSRPPLTAELFRRCATVFVGSAVVITLLVWRTDRAESLAQTARVVRVVSSNGAAGGVAQAPIVIESQGNEVGVQFTLNFNPALLTFQKAEAGGDAQNNQFFETNQTQIGQGRVGVILLLRNALPAGARQLAVVSFQIAGSASSGQRAPLTFGSEPIRQRVINANAEPLQADFIGGEITITPPQIEADAIPRPNGDGLLSGSDADQIGRFVAALDATGSGAEFQRADCAPRGTLGDGRLTVIDWAQARRYAAGLDPATPAGGPVTPAAAAPIEAGPSSGQQTSRAVRAVSANFERGQTGSVFIDLDSQGDENAAGFSVNFDPTQLRFVSAALGSSASGGALNVNLSQSSSGRVGVVVALPAGRSFAAGARRIVSFNFAAASAGNSTTTPINLTDQPVMREIAAVTARGLQAVFSGGSATISRTVATVSAASFAGNELAPESIAAAFGSNLATEIKIAATIPLPTELAGTRVLVKDSDGVERQSPLFFVAPTQANFLIPSGTAPGAAAVTVTSGAGEVSTGKLNIATVTPALFTANASGQGVAAAVALRVKANGAQIFEPVAQFDPAQNRIVPIPIDLGPESDQVFLILYGTGVRFRNSLSSVAASIGGVNSQVFYAGDVGGFAGLDQINLLLPRSLAGRSEIDVKIVVDGAAANVVRISVK